MAYVRVEQRNAHLAGPVRLEWVDGREGRLAKGTLTAISNIRRGADKEEVTSILWTLWGVQAENAAAYLTKGSHVNVVGRLRNHSFKDAEGRTVYGMSFTCEEIDYLDSRAEAAARRAQAAAKGSSDNRAAQPTDDDVPF